MKHISDEVLIAYIEGELDAREQERVREHLEVCDICMDNYRAYVAIVQSIEGLSPIPAPEVLDDMVKARLQPRRPFALVGALAFSFATVALLIYLPGLISRISTWLLEHLDGRLLISMAIRGVEYIVGIYTLMTRTLDPIDVLWGLILLSVLMAMLVKRRLERYAGSVD